MYFRVEPFKLWSDFLEAKALRSQSSISTNIWWQQLKPVIRWAHGLKRFGLLVFLIGSKFVLAFLLMGRIWKSWVKNHNTYFVPKKVMFCTWNTLLLAYFSCTDVWDIGMIFLTRIFVTEELKTCITKTKASPPKAPIWVLTSLQHIIERRVPILFSYPHP